MGAYSIGLTIPGKLGCPNQRKSWQGFKRQIFQTQSRNFTSMLNGSNVSLEQITFGLKVLHQNTVDHGVKPRNVLEQTGWGQFYKSQ